MKVEDLQDYIAKFREWLDLHAIPLLRDENLSLVTIWREELAAP